MERPQCDYLGCTECVCDEDLSLSETTKRFCAKHSQESAELIRNNDIPGLLEFWSRSGIGYRASREKDSSGTSI